MSFDFTSYSHRRWNPLTRSWILCSPHRAKRPWQGQIEKLNLDTRPQFDPKCYLCPGNQRISGDQNPKYASTYVFPNDFPAVQAHQPSIDPTACADVNQSSSEADKNKERELFKFSPTRGECHVICFHPRHDLTIAQMTADEILPIIQTWTETYRKFIPVPYVGYVQIFENKGEMMGCSNPHPHGQVWCTEQIPEEPRKELDGLKAYREECGNGNGCLLCDYARLEVEKRVRVVCENEHFVCLVPWWATWPFEVMIVARTHLRHLLDLSAEQQCALADLLRRIACRYDNLFQSNFPYSMGIHQAPTLNVDALEGPVKLEAQQMIDLSHFHMHFYPPLLRSATVKKFLVGFEMLGTPQRDLTSEQAAERLRALSETHYSVNKNSQD